MQTTNDLTAFLKDKRITIVAPMARNEIIRGDAELTSRGRVIRNAKRHIYPAAGAYMAWLARELGAQVRLVTAPASDAQAQEMHMLLLAKGVEMLSTGAALRATPWYSVTLDKENHTVGLFTESEEIHQWQLPSQTELKHSAAVILFADRAGVDAELADHVRKSTLPLTMMALQQDVMIWNSAEGRTNPLHISTVDNGIDYTAWPAYAVMAKTEIIALSAAIASIPGVTIPMTDLAAQISRFHPPLLQDTGGSAQRTSGKILPLNLLKEEIAKEKAAGRTIVWTNGCFDIMHAGHATYLERAAALGDVLIVGLNSDASVKSTKGPNRPIVPEDQRARLMAALRCVDYIVIYDDDSPVELIRQLAPDIYAKGGDYNIDTINQPERRLMESLGGRIELLPGVPGISTSVIIKNILKAYSNEAPSE